MQRSHWFRWLGLGIGLLGGTQCIDSISDDCTKTLTCEGVPQPSLNEQTCQWEYSDGTVWADGPRFERGRWRWPDGKETEKQDFKCDVAGDAGVDAGPAGPDCRVNLTCDEGQTCDPASGNCVECVDDTQCAGNMPMGDAGAATVCDRVAHRCVECVGNDNCSGDTRICKVDTSNSRRNACVECLTSENCDDPAASICDDRTNDCTSRCTTAADCTGDKKACNTTRQICVECTANDNCSGNPGKTLCDTDNNQCVECLDDGQCASSGRVCDLETHSCVECREDAQCLASPDAARRPICNPDTKLCVGCLNDLQCTTGEASRCNVVEHQCTGCTSSTQCEGGAECNTSTGACVECVVNSDCADVEGRPFCESTQGRCVECLLTNQCLSDTAARCETTVGSPSRYTCVGCVDETDCGGKPNVPGLCDAARGVCVDCLGPAECVENGVSGSRCQNGSCVTCVNDADCDLFADAPENAPACKPNVGCVECVDSQDCAGKPGLSVCKTIAGSGAAPINTCVECTDNTQCQTRPDASLCLDNECVPCRADADCNLVDSNGSQAGGINLHVCDAGTCVECTGPKNGACSNGTNVCNSTTKACTLTAVGSAALCDSCVSDNQCATTARCVQQAALGFFCMPLQAQGACPASGPTRGFIQQATSATIDTPSAAVCQPRLATCPAFVAYRAGRACDDANDDETCGQGGSCEPVPGGGNDFLCTIPCAGVSDCLSGSCLDDLCSL